YTLFPKHHRTIGKLFLVACVLMSLFPMAVGEAPWFGWLVFAGFISLVLGLGHPPTIDQDSPLDPRRRIAAWATVGLFIVTFSPVPFSFQEPSQQPPAAGRTIEVRENLAPLVGPQGAPSRVLSIDFTANQGIANG
ncbi:MAG TPA: hypothetical protein VMT58_02285, partial [Candidatus Binataceae bacterium]|nr:hypothetical protein [Candidatus Binataceae bacterium]